MSKALDFLTLPAVVIRADFHHDADLAAQVNVGGNDAGSFIPLKAADGNLLSDGDGSVADHVGDGLALVIDELLGQQGIHIRGIRQGDVLGDAVGEVLEIVGVGNEVSLTVDLDDGAHGAVLADVLGDSTFRGDAAGLLGGLAQSLLTQPLNGLVHVAVALHEGLFAVHHAGAGALAQFFYHRSSNSCHLESFLSVYLNNFLRKSFPEEMFHSRMAEAENGMDYPIWNQASGASSAGASAASGASGSVCSPCLPSRTASAILPAISLTARMASSLPGMT